MLLEVKNVKHSIKDRLLFSFNTLQIQDNDRIGLIGKNGSGKTTLLKILVGEIHPDEGIVSTDEKCERLPQFKQLNTIKSGGEVTQEYINKIFLNYPKIIFADEPTANLDTNHIEWLQRKFVNWQGALVVVSHDREFLDSICTKIWEINNETIAEYKGNYTDYMEKKELHQREHQMNYEKYVKKKQQLEDALKLKVKKAQRATKKPKKTSSSEAKITGAKPYFAKKQKKLQQTAKAMESRIEKLDKVDKLYEHKPLKMQLPNETNIKGRTIIKVNEVDGYIGNRQLWKPISFHLAAGDKLAIMGANGSGKTTFLKKLINREEGISISSAIKVGYFSQNLDILQLEKSILANVSSTSKQEETLIRTVLARLHFLKDDVYKKVKVLSGGERVKVALAKLFVSDINTLVMDEPTNFLDIDAVEALEALLKEYKGTIIFSSHDRRFVENIATRILMIENAEMILFDGPYHQLKQYKRKESRTTKEDKLLLIETKLSEVLSKLSIEPSEQLEKEFQQLLKEKQQLIAE